MLFPRDDLPELQYREEDGNIVEPEYFIPIIPTILIESYEIPATGWNVKMYARDIYAVISSIAEMINVCNSDCYINDDIVIDILKHQSIYLPPYRDNNYKIIDQ